MNKTYFFCVVCGNSQKQAKTCSKCQSVALAERDLSDYEIPFYDLSVGGSMETTETTAVIETVEPVVVQSDATVAPVAEPVKEETAPITVSENADALTDKCMNDEPESVNPMEKQDEMVNKDQMAKSEIVEPVVEKTEEVVAESKTKTVAGEHLTADKFAYVGDPERTETWKLPIHDANHVRNALARFNQTEGIPESEKAKVKAKILAAAKKFGIHVSESEQEVVTAAVTLPEEQRAINAAKERMKMYLKTETVKAETTEPVAVETVVEAAPVVPEAEVVAAVTVETPETTNALDDRKLKGAMAIHVLRFSKSVWNSADAVQRFLINERIGIAYHIDQNKQLVSEIRDSGAYYEAEALPAQYFVAGSFVEHCITQAQKECAILAVSGEVQATPGHETIGDKVNSIAIAEQVSVAFINYHVQRVHDLEKELTVAHRKCQEVETTLVSIIEDKAKLADKIVVLEHDLNSMKAQAKIDARIRDLPSSVKAQIKRSPNNEILQYLSKADDQEWDLVKNTFALANHPKGFTELSELEGKLPVGGGATNENGRTLKEFLR